MRSRRTPLNFPDFFWSMNCPPNGERLGLSSDFRILENGSVNTVPFCLSACHYKERKEYVEHELRERKVNLVVTGIHGKFAEEDMVIEHLFEEPNFVVVFASSPWAKRRKVELRELIDEPWIFPPNPVIVKMIRHAFQAKKLQPPTERVSASSIPLRNYLVGQEKELFDEFLVWFNEQQQNAFYAWAV